MSVFVDTSALYALLDRRDPEHDAARRAFTDLADAGPLISHNYVVVEAEALVRYRLGSHAARALLGELVPALDLIWVDEATHQAAVAAYLSDRAPRVSLVDAVSFEVMRGRGLTRAFAFDADFVREGFKTLP